MIFINKPQVFLNLTLKVNPRVFDTGIGASRPINFPSMENRQKPIGIQRLLGVMAQLRDPETGCPWDREQDFASIAPYTVEEAYEVADAIARRDMAALRDELGDLLFQVVFHAQMARESGIFGFDDVVGAVIEKMERRHPHVFGLNSTAETDIRDAEAQTRFWEAQKAVERAESGTEDAKGALDGVAQALPALMRATKLQKRAARVGFDWADSAGVFAKAEEEMAELRAALSPQGSKGVPGAPCVAHMWASRTVCHACDVGCEPNHCKHNRLIESLQTLSEYGIACALSAHYTKLFG